MMVVCAGKMMHVVNTEYFGKVMVPLDHKFSLRDEVEQFEYVRLEANGGCLVYSLACFLNFLSFFFFYAVYSAFIVL